MAESTDPTTAVPKLYHPLDADQHELRLLEICPSEDSDSLIQVKIFTRRFEDVRGQFIPLSYVWGDPADTETIIVNGILWKVTENLALFLRQIRALLPDILTEISWEKPALFWADAICINQDDTEERNRQVQFMRSIYSSAPTVLAWLGQAEDSHLVANMADASVAWVNACKEKNPGWAGSGWWDPNFDGWMERHPDFWSFTDDLKTENPYWCALRTLLISSPYWRRTWIFQELTLPAEILFICGSTLIRLSSLRALAMWVVELNGSAASDFSFLDQGSFQGVLKEVQFSVATIGFSIQSLRSTRDQLAAQQRPTLVLVRDLAHLLASDPRDKIFGLLGVMDTQFVADYNSPVIQVYCDFVRAWMREVRDLNFLQDACRMHHPGGSTGQHGLPSWAPDWGAISWALDPGNVMVDVFPQELFCVGWASKHLHICLQALPT